MDRNRSAPPETSIDALSESQPLLHNAFERRPYQAYCVTEASSRSQSPDPFIPRPLRVDSSRPHAIDSNAQSQSYKKPELEELFVPSAASSPGQRHALAISLETESRSKRQCDSSNRILPSGNTPSANSNHIAQAVTPRGSHSLTSIAGTMCDEVLSHPRMQPSESWYIAPSQGINRKLLPCHSKHAGMGYHPLPPPPTEVSLNSNANKGESQSQTDQNYQGNCKHTLEQRQSPAWNEFREQSEEPFLSPPQHSDAETQCPSSPRSYNHDSQSILRRSVTFEDDHESPSLTTPPRNAYSRDYSRNSRYSDVLDDHAQFPSSAELYTSRDCLLEANEKAPRRTQPKDAKLKYQFGQHPSRGLDLPPPPPPHHELYRHSGHEYSSRSTHPPYLHSSTDTQGGPRPPPWGSYESLEMQRRQRGEARERAQARVHRRQMDSASMLRRGSQSTDNSGKALMRREVEEYREQVLSLYPDMAFDGEAGRGGRECCCCVIM